MLFILLVITFLNLVNAFYALGFQYHWFSQLTQEFYSSLGWLGGIGVSVLATLLTVIIATIVLLRFKKMSEYDQQFERGSMKFSIIGSLINVFISVILILLR